MFYLFTFLMQCKKVPESFTSEVNFVRTTLASVFVLVSLTLLQAEIFDRNFCILSTICQLRLEHLQTSAKIGDIFLTL